MDHKHAPFASTPAVAAYAENAVRLVPGLADLHRMAMLLLDEAAPADAHILVVGAGGGMETRAMAEARPDWRFTGVDPSAAMLDLARDTLAPFAERIELIEGTISAAPAGPFDGATCLLTLHHLGRDERLQTLTDIRRCLAPGARLVLAEHAAPGPNSMVWMTRSVAFGARDVLDWEKAAETARTMTAHLSLLTPEEEQDLLAEAGFSEVALFYAAFTFRGWMATAG